MRVVVISGKTPFTISHKSPPIGKKSTAPVLFDFTAVDVKNFLFGFRIHRFAHVSREHFRRFDPNRLMQTLNHAARLGIIGNAVLFRDA